MAAPPCYAFVELQVHGRVWPLTADQAQLIIATLELAGLRPLPVVHQHLPHPSEGAYYHRTNEVHHGNTLHHHTDDGGSKKSD